MKVIFAFICCHSFPTSNLIPPITPWQPVGKNESPTARFPGLKGDVSIDVSDFEEPAKDEKDIPTAIHSLPKSHFTSGAELLAVGAGVGVATATVGAAGVGTMLSCDGTRPRLLSSKGCFTCCG